MSQITYDSPRFIIEDFAREIEKHKSKGQKPQVDVIDFRQDRINQIERPVWEVPIELLRFRRDNGRIASDVLDYEKDNEPLNEATIEGQEKIRGFLARKDKEKTEELERLILHDGQRVPAIVTADGFLINGNRRKMVIESLRSKDPKRFAVMRVVILPGEHDNEAPPTLKEIEQIENRYQLQSEGKAEYSGFNRALSIRRKEELGMSLEEQLRDDPAFAGFDEKRFKKEVEKQREVYLKPLECIDRYLDHIGRPGLYGLISTSSGDSEGKWQAFTDYYGSVYKKLTVEKDRLKIGVKKEEVGAIEDIAFKIIRKRSIPNVGKVHKIIRDLPKYLGVDSAKKELMKLTSVPIELPDLAVQDSESEEMDAQTYEAKWASANAVTIIRQVKSAHELYNNSVSQQEPLSLLQSALNKLEHENMEPSMIALGNIDDAMELTELIEERAKELRSKFFHYQKETKKLQAKFEKHN